MTYEKLVEKAKMELTGETLNDFMNVERAFEKFLDELACS